MLLDFAQDALKFIDENKILLIVIAVAIVLLIAISVFGSIKNKADKKKESEEKSDDSKEESNDGNFSSEQPEEALEAPAEEALIEETPEEEAIAAEEVLAEESVEEKPETTEEVVEEQQPLEEIVADQPAEEVPAEEVKSEEQSETAASVEQPASAEQPAEEEAPKGLPGTVEIYKGKNDFYFNFRASNNILIGRSQGYTTKASCKNSAEAVMNMAKIATTHDSTKEENSSKYRPAFGKSVFQLYIDREGKYRWRLYAKNQQNILASKGYTTKANAKSAIQSLKKIAANYVLVDLTKQS